MRGAVRGRVRMVRRQRWCGGARGGVCVRWPHRAASAAPRRPAPPRLTPTRQAVRGAARTARAQHPPPVLRRRRDAYADPVGRARVRRDVGVVVDGLDALQVDEARVARVQVEVPPAALLGGEDHLGLGLKHRLHHLLRWVGGQRRLGAVDAVRVAQGVEPGGEDLERALARHLVHLRAQQPVLVAVQPIELRAAVADGADERVRRVVGHDLLGALRGVRAGGMREDGARVSTNHRP